ncbi:MAG: cytidylate kinase family protein [Nanoarchaeota archaeon]|nr:cytidylate kinase family protein [Nanoarchaeota archaeon]
MIITISGKPGSGKNTVSDILAKELNLERYSVGNYRREMARKRGLTIAELNALGEKEDFTDKEADNWQIEIGKTKDNFIIDGKLSYYFIPNSLKVFLNVSPEIGSRRIMLHGRIEERMNNEQEALRLWHERYNSDIIRYQKYYGLNPHDKEQFDFILDTSYRTIDKVVEETLGFIRR